MGYLNRCFLFFNVVFRGDNVCLWVDSALEVDHAFVVFVLLFFCSWSGLISMQTNRDLVRPWMACGFADPWVWSHLDMSSTYFQEETVEFADRMRPYGSSSGIVFLTSCSNTMGFLHLQPVECALGFAET